jgi:hypothetical protein
MNKVGKSKVFLESCGMMEQGIGDPHSVLHRVAFCKHEFIFLLKASLRQNWELGSLLGCSGLPNFFLCV